MPGLQGWADPTDAMARRDRVPASERSIMVTPPGYAGPIARGAVPAEVKFSALERLDVQPVDRLDLVVEVRRLPPAGGDRRVHHHVDRRRPDDDAVLGEGIESVL